MPNHDRSKYSPNGGEQSSYHDFHSQSAAGRPFDSDRSDIRVLEPEPSAQPNGDQLCGAHAQEEAESLRLITAAKVHGLYIPFDKLSSLGMLHRIPSGESQVYYNEAQNLVYKVRNPFAKRVIKDIVPRDVIYEHLIHNLLFPEARYNFIGVSEEHEEVRLVLSQTYFDTLMPASDRRIESFLIGRGLTKEGSYFYGNEYFSITDVGQESDNVFVGSDGKLLFVDPIIRLKKPALEVLEYLQQHPLVPISTERPSLWQRLTSRLKH